MKAKKCDRCGSFYEPYGKMQNPKNASGIMLINIDENGKYWVNPITDMCPDCMKQLYDFLGGVKNATPRP